MEALITLYTTHEKAESKKPYIVNILTQCSQLDLSHTLQRWQENMDSAAKIL
jgi:hypothetical protein